MSVVPLTSAAEARAAGQTYHLTPEVVWQRQASSGAYVPEQYAADGFIHATDGIEPLLVVANMFYHGDRRPYLVLVLDIAMIVPEVRYEDAGEIYPHIYGPLNTDAVIGLLRARRGENGRFLAVDPAD